MPPNAHALPISLHHWDVTAPTRACSGNLFHALLGLSFVLQCQHLTVWISWTKNNSFGTVWLCISHVVGPPMGAPQHVVEPCFLTIGAFCVLPSQCPTFLWYAYFWQTFKNKMLICPGGSIYLASTCLPSTQAVTLENISFLGGALFSLHFLPPIFVYLF